MIKNFISQNKPALKIIGYGFTISLLVLIFSVLTASLLYQKKPLAKRGFEIEIKLVTKEVGGVKTGNLPDAKSSVSSKKTVDIAAMVASADIDAGAKVFKKCATCHTINQGGSNKVGPNLYGISGKKIATMNGFNYSPSLKSKGGSWSINNLDLWLTNPKSFVPGNKMGFAGLKKDKDRANVIAYLKQQGK